jgi:hypothetical protein
MRQRDTIALTEAGIRYARGVHVVRRRPDLRIISVNHRGEIVEEYVQYMGESDTEASARVIALIETAQILIQQQELRSQEPWFNEVPLFVPPYETPEAEQTAVGYIQALLRPREEATKIPSSRGVHCVSSKDHDHTLLLVAVTSRGERLGQCAFDVLSDPGERLLGFRKELEELLDECDPQ